jgi:hypothetical protein
MEFPSTSQILKNIKNRGKRWQEIEKERLREEERD